MEIEYLKAHGVNYDDGLKRFMGNNELYEKYLRKLPADANFAKLEHALNTENFEDAFTYAHTLKGIVGNLSIDDFFHTLYDVVESLRVKNIENASQQFKILKAQYIEVVEALKEQE
ncbi:MAG: hypothetical protein PHD56_01300 [Anaerostipes sp.]|nr:hypothetical protein [Anaerostipes sp.]